MTADAADETTRTRADRRRVVDRRCRFGEHSCTVKRNDASALDAAALAAEYAEDLIVGTVRDVHGAVARAGSTG